MFFNITLLHSLHHNHQVSLRFNHHDNHHRNRLDIHRLYHQLSHQNNPLVSPHRHLPHTLLRNPLHNPVDSPFLLLLVNHQYILHRSPPSSHSARLLLYHRCSLFQIHHPNQLHSHRLDQVVVLPYSLLRSQFQSLQVDRPVNLHFVPLHDLCFQLFHLCPSLLKKFLKRIT